MLKKAIALLVPVAAVVAVALIPLASASADCRYPPGTPHTKAYCKHFCKVPKVTAKSLKTAEKLLSAHSCKTGKIVKLNKKPSGKSRLVVSKQGAKAGKSFAAGHKVKLFVKYNKKK